MHLPRPTLLGLLLSAGLLSSSTAFAAFGCYDLDHYPSVGALARVQGKLQARLGSEPGASGQNDMQINRDAVLGPDGNWKSKKSLCTTDGCRSREEISARCDQDVPEIHLSLDEIKHLSPEAAGSIDTSGGEDGGTGIEQKAVSCVKQGDIVWFGIGFYCGEGVCGLGGIGRYDTKTGKLEVRRPKPLLNASVAPLASDGRYLWVGTYSSSECVGEDPVSGLVRYDWEHDTAVSFGGGTDSGHDPDGPCGFQFHDIYIDKQGLWTSSDMGLSFLADPQAAPDAMHWTHYAPDAGGNLAKTTCADLYTGLLKTLPSRDHAGGASEFDGQREQFRATLKRFNPTLAAKLTPAD